jgi:hypothetical protein
MVTWVFAALLKGKSHGRTETLQEGTEKTEGEEVGGIIGAG